MLIAPARLLNSIACRTGKFTKRLKNIIGLDTVQPQYSLKPELSNNAAQPMSSLQTAALAPAPDRAPG